MSMKGNKVQPVRLSVENVDSNDEYSVSSSNVPGISFSRNGINDTPILQQRKKSRNHSYSGPAQNNGSSQGSNSSNYNTTNQGDNSSNPHLKYARTLGYVSDTQSQISFLSSPGTPQKLKSRARSFSGDNRFINGDDSESNNNSRNGSRRSSVQPNGASLSRANSQKLLSSTASLSARKKRVTFRHPLVDDKMDHEASRKFSRSYTGSGNMTAVGFFGLNSRQNSQAKLNVDTNEDLASSPSDENVAAAKKPSARGKNKGKNNHHNNARRENSFNTSKRNAGWAKWLGMQWIFSSANFQAANAESSSSAEISSTNSMTNNNVGNANNGGNGNRSTGDSNSSPPINNTSKNCDDSVSDFSLSQIALEPGSTGNANSSNSKASGGTTWNSMIKNSNSTTAPNTPRSSILLFAMWIAGNNQSNSSSTGNTTDKVQ